MKNPILAVVLLGFATLMQPAANAQFGSGIVFDPTQSGHAITQIEHEERSIANQAQQIEQGQQIFTNTVKIATTALQTYNTVMQQYQLSRQMILAPRMLYARFLSPTSDLLLLRQVSNTYGNSMGWLNSANTGNGATAAYQQVSVPKTSNTIPGYSTASRLSYNQIPTVAKRHKVEVKKDSDSGQELLAKQVGNYDESELCRVLLEISLLDSAYRRATTDGEDILLSVAKRYRVDVEKLQKAVAAEFAAKRDKKKAKPKAETAA